MAVSAGLWLDLSRREYLQHFIPGGGTAVKFVVGDEAHLAGIEGRLQSLAADRQLDFVKVDAADTKLHMMQDVFFAVAKRIDWDAFAQHWVERMFRQNLYEWPRPEHAVPLKEVAAANRINDILLRREVIRWLGDFIMTDRLLAQDFRSAMAHLCLLRMEPEMQAVSPPVIEWLHGDLRTIGSVRSVPISAKITRHNGRAMLRSLCRWLRLSGGPGLVIAVDLRQIGRNAPSAAGIRYTPGSVLDAFELLRQLVDDSENVEGLFFVGLADDTLVNGDPRRSVDAYSALKLRVWSDVSARAHDNPLAPLVTVGNAISQPANHSAGLEMPLSEERVAIEALRAGVPNRAAIRRLGSSEPELSAQFERHLAHMRRGGPPPPGKGVIFFGGFGTGKSHLLGHFTEKALAENFIVSTVAISKETPLFHQERLFAEAMRNAVAPEVNDGVVVVTLQKLGADTRRQAELEEWAGDPANGFSPLFSAMLYLLQRQTTTAEDTAAIARFFAGSKFPVTRVRQLLNAAGAGKIFDLRTVPQAEIARQRIRFLPALFRAAGYAGWCVMFDEAELIGRYSVLQRARSYAELARWLSLDDAAGVPGVVGVAAFVEDFKSMVLDQRLDEERVPAALTARGLDEEVRLAGIAMNAIRTGRNVLRPPDDRRLQRSLAQVLDLYRSSYGWGPKSAATGPREAGKTMRQYIKSWITAFDVERIYGVVETIDTQNLVPDMGENSELETPSAEGDDESETA